MLVGLIVFPGVACYLFTARPSVQDVAAYQVPVQTQVIMTANALVHGTGTPTAPVQHGLIFPSVTPTAYITNTPSPTATLKSLVFPTVAISTSVNVNTPMPMQFALSFYDPHIYAVIRDVQLRDVNCLQWSDLLNDCVSKVHRGQDDYHQWLGKGAACPKELATDTVFRVDSPVQLAGVWRCIDTGDLDQYKNGQWYHYIDFMLTYPDMVWTGSNLNAFPWSSPVYITVLSVP